MAALPAAFTAALVTTVAAVEVAKALPLRRVAATCGAK
jgi:hypothetical protein